MKKYCLRHWRGNGQVIADVVKPQYNDYPKHRNKRAYSSSECIIKEISKEEYLRIKQSENK